MENTLILVVEELSVNELKTNKRVLDNLTFQVERNEFLGILAPSGSGKTTLLKTIMRICPKSLHSSGLITYFPDTKNKIVIQEKTNVHSSAVLSRELTYIPQNASEAFDPIEKMGVQLKETLTENRFSVSERTNMIQELLESMDLPESILNKYPFQLSGGTLQRCAIGLALILKSKVIIADEPTSALDTINRKRILDSFLQLKKRNETTLLLATHDIAIVDYLCDTALVLEAGRKIEHKKIDKMDTDSTSYLVKMRRIKNKIGSTFWRLKDGKLVSS
ncbi:nickel transport system ATP-binding protein [Enterococcus sp. AZ170]|uniref:ATP-binding cassette domain-containing protein n=1 Tax=unclassified Enterococcus TaxID=2608891 RepID=UPI003D294019